MLANACSLSVSAHPCPLCVSQVSADNIGIVLQILVHNLGTMELAFSVMTHPAAPSGQLHDEHARTVPIALGPRWLAYAANQVRMTLPLPLHFLLHTSQGCACRCRLDAKYAWL